MGNNLSCIQRPRMRQQPAAAWTDGRHHGSRPTSPLSCSCTYTRPRKIDSFNPLPPSLTMAHQDEQLAFSSERTFLPVSPASLPTYFLPPFFASIIFLSECTSP